MVTSTVRQSQLGLPDHEIYRLGVLFGKKCVRPRLEPRGKHVTLCSGVLPLVMIATSACPAS